MASSVVSIGTFGFRWVQFLDRSSRRGPSVLRSFVGPVFFVQLQPLLLLLLLLSAACLPACLHRPQLNSTQLTISDSTRRTQGSGSGVVRRRRRFQCRLFFSLLCFAVLLHSQPRLPMVPSLAYEYIVVLVARPTYFVHTCFPIQPSPAPAQISKPASPQARTPAHPTGMTLTLL